jgi:hypothetical protein
MKSKNYVVFTNKHTEILIKIIYNTFNDSGKNIFF